MSSIWKTLLRILSHFEVTSLLDNLQVIAEERVQSHFLIVIASFKRSSCVKGELDFYNQLG